MKSIHVSLPATRWRIIPICVALEIILMILIGLSPHRLISHEEQITKYYNSIESEILLDVRYSRTYAVVISSGALCGILYIA